MYDLQPVVTEMTKARSVIQGATAFVNTVPGLIQKAKDDAIALGATAEQLAPVQALADSLSTEADTLTNAMLANTPGQPVVPA